MEKIDSCIACSRLNAAIYFAKKKKITLRNWLEIYNVFAYKNYDKIYGKNIFFKYRGITLIQYKVLKFQLHVVQRFNNTELELRKIITKNNFITFLDKMNKDGWEIMIEQYPSESISY